MKWLNFFILIILLGVACRENSYEEPSTATPETFESTSATIAAETDQVTITLAVEAFNLGYYRPLITQFEQEQPEIKVNLVSTSDIATPDDDEIRAKATSFDLFPHSPNRDGGAQYLLDLRPFLATDPQFNPDDFYPGLLPNAQDPLLVIPTGAAYYLTFYDKTAFDAANRPYPDLEWTTDDFLASALALTSRADGEVTRWGYVPGQLLFSPLFATQLNEPLDEGGQSRLADPDVATAVTWMSDLFTLHQVSPWLDFYKPADRRSGNDGQSSQTLIANGMAAMWHSTHLLYDENNANVGVTAVPHGSNGFAAEPIINGFAISSGTRNPEAAWQLASFLSRQLPPVESGLPTHPVPARRSVAVATGYWEQLPIELATILGYTAENNQSPRIDIQTANLLLETLISHIDDNISVTASLDQAETAVEESTESTTDIVVIVEEAAPEIPQDAIQITFTTYSYLQERHQLLIEEFQNTHPNIVVNLTSPADTLASSSIETLLTDKPDCFMGSGDDLQNDDLSTTILQINPFLELDNSLQLDDFYSVQTSYFIKNGELWAIPAYTQTRLLEFNRTMFQNANVPEPLLDWTLTDFLEIAELMTQGSGDSRQYGYAETLEYLMLVGLDAFDVQYIDNSSAVPTFNYEDANEMLTWYADLVRLHRVQPPLTGYLPADYSQFDTLVRHSQAAMWPFPESHSLELDAPLEFDIGVVPIPLGPSESRGNLKRTVHGYFIMADSPNPEACWEWIAFLTRHPQAIWLRQSVPAHIETAESDEYTINVGQELADANRAYMAFSKPASLIEEPDWFFPGRFWLRRAYIKASNRELSVAEALTDADVKFAQYRQCLIDANGFEDYGIQIGCAVLADPTLADRYGVEPDE